MRYFPVIFSVLLALTAISCKRSDNSTIQDIIEEDPEHNPVIYYVDPTEGDIKNDGLSPETAWSTLSEVAESSFFKSVIMPGDQIICMAGKHGMVRLAGLNFSPPVEIFSEPGSRPAIVSAFLTDNVSGLSIRNIIFTPWIKDEYFVSEDGIVKLDGDNNSIEGCLICSIPDNYQLSLHEMGTILSPGITLNGNNFYVRYNRIWNVDNGIQVAGDDGACNQNLVYYYTGKGLDCNGSDLAVHRNVIFDGIETDTVPIGIRSSDHFTSSRMAQNAVFQSVHDDEKGFVFNPVQGISMSNMDHCLFTNNYVISNLEFGIGCTANDSTFVNNTLIGFQEGVGASFRILGNDNRVRNNLAPAFSTNDDSSLLYNWTYFESDIPVLFQDPESYNYRIRSDSPVVNSGTGELAPLVDFENDKRPSLGGYDIGADEFTDSQENLLGGFGIVLPELRETELSIHNMILEMKEGPEGNKSLSEINSH